MITLSDIAKRTKRIEEEKRKGVEKQITITDTGMIIHAKEQDKIYIPTATGDIAHRDDSFVRVIMGPYGSGKSTWAITEIVKRACTVPAWHSGRRRSRWGIVRNTSGELQTTTLATWLAWFEDLGDIHHRQKPMMTYEHSFNDGNGIVELELLFIALDRPDDVRKIKSLELTGCYINELSEVPKAALAHMKGRVNRYPSKAFCHEPYWSGIIADTNPPEDDHWIYKDFEEAKFDNHMLFKQPPGLIKNADTNKWVRNPSADNAAHLPNNYYEMLAEGQSQEFIKVFCLGEYGSVGFGRRVFPEFNPDFHAVESLQAIQGQQLILGWDFGLTPACVVMQLSLRGQLLILKEYVAHDMGIRTFADSIVIPSLLKDFPYCKVGISIADPAGNHRSEIIEEMSCIGELTSLDIPTRGARTNDIDPRLGSVRYFLNKMIDGKPGFVLDRRNCPTLFKGFVKDYVYARVAVSGEERYKDKPNKNMASHPMDALGYGCLELASDRIAQDKMGDKPAVNMYNPVMRLF